MDKLTNITQHSQPTMSSREIAELCDKEHRNVCRDIENLNATYGQMGLLKIEQTPYTHEQNGQTLTADDQYDEKLNGLTRRSR